MTDLALRHRFVAFLALVPGLAPAPMHGGGQATSNYRTDQTAVSPAVDGLTVGYQDSDSTVTLDWTGSGEVIVLGYEGEPFLRIDPSGVERNVHSPATYLNTDRYARVQLPVQADATAAPEWERLSTTPSTSWHDHRTHWMDPTPSAEVRAHPDQLTVVFPKWEIPVTVDGEPATITGRLLWVPPPSRTPWLLMGLGLAVVLGLVVALVRKGIVWPVLAVGGVAAGLFTLDSISYLTVTTGTSSGRIWYVIWPVVVVGALAVAAIQTRRPGRGVISLAVAGAILAIVGGWDRLDSLSHSQVFGSLPDWFSRASAVTCFVAGLALLGAAVVRIFAVVPASPESAN